MPITSGNSQITLTKDVSYGNNGTVDFSSNNNLVWNRHYITSDNHVVICPLEGFSTPVNANFLTYDSNGNPLSTITIPSQGDVSILYADNNNVYPVVDGKLYKYLLNGNLDTSFGTNGELFIGSNLSATNYLTAVRLPDSKILVRNQDNFTRYYSNGVIDTSYGNNGVVNISGSSSPYSVLNERIDNNYFFENFNGRRKININTGALDLSYGNNGYSVYSNQSGYVPFDPEAVTNNFEIITLLYKNGSGFDYAISKTKADGNIDAAFGGSGILDLSEIFNTKILYYGLTLGMDSFNSKVFLPLTVRLQQGSDIGSKVGFSCYSINGGNSVMINNGTVFETDIQGGGNISAKVYGNYLYLFTQGSVTRYIINESSLTTNEINIDNQINFNNPFSNELNFNSKEKIKQVDIYDETGRLVLKEKVKNEINTLHLNKGVYLIKITTESNKIISKKAIKN